MYGMARAGGAVADAQISLGDWQEAGLDAKVRELEARASDAMQGRGTSDEAAASAESRARHAEQALAIADRRAAEQATALANLQALLEQMQSQVRARHIRRWCRFTRGPAPPAIRALPTRPFWPRSQVTGPSDELSQMRLGGRVLVSELQLVESMHADAQEAQAELPMLRSELDVARLAGERLSAEVAGLQALLRTASAAREHESLIDKRLVVSVLIKYFERESSSEVLAVLSSMLGCTREEQQVLGLLPRGASVPSADAKLTDGEWESFWLGLGLNFDFGGNLGAVSVRALFARLSQI